MLATLVLPRVSEWHVLLSDMLMPEDDLFLDADLLTRVWCAIYQGRVQDKMLGAEWLAGQHHAGESTKRFLRGGISEGRGFFRRLCSKVVRDRNSGDRFREICLW